MSIFFINTFVTENCVDEIELSRQTIKTTTTKPNNALRSAAEILMKLKLESVVEIDEGKCYS